VATPHPVLKHAHEQLTEDLVVGRPAFRRLGRVRAGLLIGAAAALTVTTLPGTAAADPGRATSAADAAARVAEANHQLEVVSEQVNEARVVLEQQQAGAVAADAAAAEARKKLDALDGQIRELARSAYTTQGFTRLDVLLTSDSADEFVHQLGTLDAIAGHTNDLVSDVASAADQAQSAQDAADEASAQAQKAYDDIASQQKDLESQIADYQAQYAALSAPQQQQVSRAHGGGESLPVPTSVAAPSGAAQVAVNTALAQVGDPYVYGAGGPDAFDCSGLTQYAYSAAGVSLPHSSASQSRMGTPVSRDQLQPGDLVFFYSPVSHVGMYIGNGQMVHASTSGQPVKVASLDSMGSYNSARRITG
jgi:cell wall-associated NlpC family hydrolase